MGTSDLEVAALRFGFYVAIIRAVWKISIIVPCFNEEETLLLFYDEATKAMLQIKDLLLENENLKNGAKNNNEDDFIFSFYDDADEALLEGLMDNNEFFTILLNDRNLKKRVLDAFKHSVYEQLKKD